MQKHLLTIDQLAETLQVPRSWIYEKARTNKIPFIKIGKYLRFSEEAIQEWIRSNSSLKTYKNAKSRSLEGISNGLY